MQNDLISRSALIETIEQDIKMTEKFMERVSMPCQEYSCLNAQLNTLKSYRAIVEDKPCAYDVEKVVEQAHQIFIDELNIILEDIPEGTPYTKEAHRLLSLNKKINNAIRNGGK